MVFLLFAFAMGMLTVLAPCILPLLPIIIGGSITETHSRLKPFIITGALVVSVVLFTLLLKVSTAFTDIPREFWSYLSGGILIGFGIVTLLPTLWERFIAKFSSGSANKLIAKGTQKKSFWGDVMIGAALGPVFSSCSPTYVAILATILPQSFAVGFVALIAYVSGLAFILLLIAFFGQRLTARLSGAADPHGWFKRVLGIIFLAVGVAISFGFDKKIESRILDTGLYHQIGEFEQRSLENFSLDFF